jgi:hypothetical protein
VGRVGLAKVLQEDFDCCKESMCRPSVYAALACQAADVLVKLEASQEAEKALVEAEQVWMQALFCQVTT